MAKAGRYYHGKANLTSLGMPKKIITLKWADWANFDDFSNRYTTLYVTATTRLIIGAQYFRGAL